MTITLLQQCCLAKKRYEVECCKSYEMVDVLGLIDDVEARGVLLSGYPGNERSESLQAQLRKHHRNLNRLEEQAAEYPANQVPVHLQNQIEAEKESIDNLEDELEALQGG